MTSSMTGRNGLPDALGNRPEPQVAVATTPAPISTPAATLAATTHASASDSDSRDSKGATSAPPSASFSANTLSSTAAGPVADSSSSSSATSAPPPPPTAAAPSAPTPAPAAPSTTSPTATSTAPAPRPSTPNREAAPASASATAPASQPAPSTPPPRSALNTLANSALASDNAALGTRPQEAATDAKDSTSADANSSDHPMPDAPAPVDASAPSDSAVKLEQSTPVQMHPPANNMTEFAPSTPYNSVPMPTLNQHAYMMMALASMSAQPTTITPSQVTLPNPMDEAFNGLAPANSIRQANADKTLESFARIEFADSVFQMTTYAVIIGRDQRALEQARLDEKRDEAYRRRVEQHAVVGLPPPSPLRGPERSKFSKSYVSEEGGMLGPESDNGEGGRPAKRRKTSTQGSSQHDNDEAAAQAQENMISNRQYVSHTPGAAAVDLTSLRPSPWHIPFIGIHSPGPNIASKTKAISREHLKIAYNEKEGVFEAIPLHKNGFFCEDVHYKSEKVVLKCGDRLQIKDIDFRFLINGVERGRTGAEEDVEEETAAQKRHGHGGKQMSFDFESSHVNGGVQDTSDELSEVASPPELSDFGDDEEAAEVEEDEPMETVEAEPKAEPEPEPEPERPTQAREPSVKPELIPEAEQQLHSLMPQLPKKRGPGRPPKNGIMSKREQRLLKKQQQEMAKKTLPQAPPVEPPIKRKVGRPRKHPLPDDASERPEKRKYKPRKPKEDGAEGSDAERRAREKKEKKARPKSPPLCLDVNSYTKEQLQKPNKNYGVLIDETLTAAGPDGLTLKQIYKRICERYPFFYFRTETKGWESSVRHNLIGNEAFRKDETTNLWSRVPGVELDAGKKRKASSPDRNNLAANQAYNQQYSYQYNAAQHQHVASGAPGYAPGQAPPAYQMPAYNAQQGQAARPVQPYATSASPPAPGQPAAAQPAPAQPAQPAPSQPAPGQPAPAQAQPPAAPTQPPAPAQLPAGYGPPPAPARPQLGGPQPGTYSSPYAPRPPPPANPPIKSEDGHAAPAAAASAQPPPLAAAKTVPGPAPAPRPVAAAPATAAAPAAQTARPPAASPAAATPARPVIEPRLLAAVVSLKNGLVLNLNKARSPGSEGIVMSAINRCLGLKQQATENEKMESICMKGIRQVMEGFTKGSPTPGPAASASPPANDLPPVLEPKVLTSLTGFKDVSVKALSAKLGEAKAEAVTLSAIDRVLGFADASIVPPPKEGEPGGNFEGVEQHLMKSVRQLLEGMNQTVQGS